MRLSQLEPGALVGDSGIRFLQHDGYRVHKNQRHRHAIFRCFCGRTFDARLSNVTSKRTKSCGCKSTKWMKIKARTHPLYPLYEQMLEDAPMIRAWETHPNKFFQWVMEITEGFNLDPEVLGQARLIKADNSAPWGLSNCRIDMGRGRCVERKSTKWVVQGKMYGSVKEAATVLGVSQATIRNWCGGTNYKGIVHPPKEGCYVEASYNVVGLD